MLTAETKRRLDACRDILVGKLPLPSDQIELITLALIYKFMDDLDEESVKLGGKRSFFTGPLKKYRWRALMPQTVSADERMNLFAEGTRSDRRKQEHLPALFRDIFRNSFLKFRDGRILTLFLNEVNGFVYSHSEELGNAFEYLLKTMGIQAENGQFRTPRHIIDFMVACLDPQPSDRILDPACGTGGFLVSCYKHILAQYTSPGSTMPGDKLTHDQRQKVYANLTGYDVTDLMVKLSKVNLFLHGFPDPAIHIYDTLTNDARWNEKADLILANPPFMTPKGGVSPHTKFRVSAKKSEVLFTDYIAEHLTPRRARRRHRAQRHRGHHAERLRETEPIPRRRLARCRRLASGWRVQALLRREDQHPPARQKTRAADRRKSSSLKSPPTASTSAINDEIPSRRTICRKRSAW